jgi:hypothetical protein
MKFESPSQGQEAIDASACLLRLPLTGLTARCEEYKKLNDQILAKFQNLSE